MSAKARAAALMASAGPAIAPLPGTPAEPQPQAAPAAPSAPEPQSDASAVTASAPETPAVETAPAPESESRPEKSGAQERIEDLVAQNKALREYGEWQAAQLRAQMQPKAPPAPAAPAADDAAPTLEQFNFDTTAYSRATQEWVRRQVKQEVVQEIQGQTAQQQAQAVKQAFGQREASFKAATPDYDLVISNPRLPALANQAAAAVLANEKGPELVYHLAKHPDKLAHIARMSPESQLLALGRLESELSAPRAPVKKPTTQAPPPPSVTPSSSPGPNKSDPTRMSMDEFVAAERAAAAERRAARRARQ